jgi:hypothetical protein
MTLKYQKLLSIPLEQWGKERGMEKIQWSAWALPILMPKVCWSKVMTNSVQLQPYTTYPYYVDHMEKLGFEKDADWVEYKIYIPDAIPNKAQTHFGNCHEEIRTSYQEIYFFQEDSPRLWTGSYLRSDE